MRNTREALEAALVENPDDLVLHAAYSDLLIEEGDPRGEFIRLQLMLGNANLTPQQRRSAFHRGEEMLRKYRPVWLKSNAGTPPPDWLRKAKWSRGWISAVTILRLNREDLQLLESHPSLRLLQHLGISNGIAYDHSQFLDPSDLFENGTSFGLIRFLSCLPLRNLCLRDFLGGDSIVRALVECELLRRLQTLQLSDCQLTDDGARMLARVPTISQLDVLNLSENYISPAGFADLRAAGAKVFGEASQRFGRPIG